MILLIALAIILFLLSLMMKRRYGVLGLALCAGALLAETQSRGVAELVEGGNIVLQPLSSTALAAAILTLLPSFVLLFGGPRYSSSKAAVVGSLGYALLAVLLLLGPLSGSLAFDSSSRDFLWLVARYESVLIATAVIFAVIDMWLTHIPKLGKDKEKH